MPKCKHWLNPKECSLCLGMKQTNIGETGSPKWFVTRESSQVRIAAALKDGFAAMYGSDGFGQDK